MTRLVRWRSRITNVQRDKLVTYGINQVRIIKEFSYEEMVYFLLFGKKPSRIESRLLRAVILSHCSHGITGQSTLATRMAADCRSPFLNAALGGFLVGSGTFHQGGLEMAMKELQSAITVPSIEEYVSKKLSRKQVIYGYGHRFHKHDPRARCLMNLCRKHSFLGPNVTAAIQIDRILWREKKVHMNIEAACGSILLDMGFPPEIAALIILIGRGPMFAAAYMERLASSKKVFQKIKVFDLVPAQKGKNHG